MEFRYSIPLPALENPTDSLAGDIPLRRHLTPLKEDVGAIRAQQDWERLVGPLNDFKGGLSHKYGLMQVAVPECNPERLELLAYASEVGFLYDDCTEFLKQEELERANDEMQSNFKEGVKKGIIDSKSGGLKALQSKLLQDMMAIDRPRALTAMKVWVEFLEEAAGRQHEAIHTTFDSYMRYRILDVGEMFWFGLVTFGMALTIPEADLPILRELTRPCWIVLALQNDICSYNKERAAAEKNDVDHFVNALCVLMTEHNVDLEGAKALCRQEIQCKVREYQQNVEAHRTDENLAKDTRVYLESLLYTISGDAAWSLITPRYNADQTYNDFQIRMLKDGPEEALSTLQTADELPTTLIGRSGVLDKSRSMVKSEVLAYQKYVKLAVSG